MHTQFDRRLLDWVSRCCRDVARAAGQPQACSAAAAELAPRIAGLARRLAAQNDFQARWAARTTEAGLAELMRRLERRLHAVHQAFASAGLDAHLQPLTLEPAEVRELETIVGELEARLTELAYDLHWRATQLPPGKADALRQDFEASVPLPLAA